MRDVIDVKMLRRQYCNDGFCVTPPVVAQDLLDEATVAAEAVAAGETDTGMAPKLRERERGNGPQRLVKIAEPHNCSHVLRRLVTLPGIWSLAAAVTGARALQVWAVDLFIKRPTAEAPVGNIGARSCGVRPSLRLTTAVAIGLRDPAGEHTEQPRVAGDHRRAGAEPRAASGLVRAPPRQQQGQVARPEPLGEPPGGR